MEKGIFLKKKFILIAIPLILLLLSPPLYYFYQEYNKMRAEYEKTKLQLGQSSTVLGSNTQSILDKVGKLIELPNESPTVATVSDVTKLKNQPFFKNAQNEDVVIVYKDAKKAILYREAINKIIEVGNINISEETKPSVIPTPTATLPSPTVNVSPKTIAPTTRITPTITPTP